jgi:hypothetical protein
MTTFYPSSCLGGWNNPRNAEGSPQTESNDDELKFTNENSAILPEGTHTEIYCGNFVGEIEQNTKPTKILVSLAWSKGEAPTLTREVTGDSFASSTGVILDTASTTKVSFTSTEGTTTATTEPATSSSVTIQDSTIQNESASTSESVVGSVINLVQDAFNSFLSADENASTTSSQAPSVDSGVLIPEVPANIPPQDSPLKIETPIPETAPTSLLQITLKKFTQYFVKTVYAEEVVSNLQDSSTSSILTITSTTSDVVVAGEQISTASDTDSVATVSKVSLDVATSSLLGSTAEEVLVATGTEGGGDVSSSVGTITEIVATTTEVVLDSNTEDDAQNNFLEVLYTFDGVVWKSLGKVNEVSMKYRTFEIPVTATTSWGNMGRLQIKVQTLQRIDIIPTVYLDAVKVDVLYETAVIHEHPDFARDIILKDKSDDGVHVVNIINGDTNNNEIWYTTIDTQGEYGVAPGTWVQVDLSQTSPSHKLLDIYGQNIFWVDEVGKLLWVTNLQRETNDGIGLIDKASTTVTFTKKNGEEWIFEYNNTTKNSVARIKV